MKNQIFEAVKDYIFRFTNYLSMRKLFFLYHLGSKS